MPKGVPAAYGRCLDEISTRRARILRRNLAKRDSQHCECSPPSRGNPSSPLPSERSPPAVFVLLEKAILLSGQSASSLQLEHLCALRVPWSFQECSPASDSSSASPMDPPRPEGAQQHFYPFSLVLTNSRRTATSLGEVVFIPQIFAAPDPI